MDEKKVKIIEGLKLPATATLLYLIFAVSLFYSGNGKGWWGFVALAMGVYSFAIWGLYLIKIHTIFRGNGRVLSKSMHYLARIFDVMIVLSILTWTYLLFFSQGLLYFVPLATMSAIIALEIIIVFLPEVKETFNVA